MAYDPEKIAAFLSDIVRNLGKGNNTVQFYAEQAIIVLTVEELNVRIDTLKSIKHILNKTQTKDIEKIIDQYEQMKNTLYNNSNMNIDD